MLLSIFGLFGLVFLLEIARKMRMTRDAGRDRPMYEIYFTRRDRIRYPHIRIRLRAFDADDACLRVAEHYRHWPLTILKVRQVRNEVQCPESQ